MRAMYVYILECSDKSFYVGVTNDISIRLDTHQKGINKDCYTFSRRPVKLVFYTMFDNPLSAISYEKKLKKWGRAKKIALINGVLHPRAPRPLMGSG